VYGELHSQFACQLLNELCLSQRSTFVHLGCGFGKLVTQAAMQTGCRSYGIESQPALWAEAVALAQAARQRCQRASALLGPLIIEHAEIFNGIHVQRCMEVADVVFINNQGFVQSVNARIYQELFPILKRGAVVITT
ncbi:histone methylation DOT1, partial [Schizophyllum commune]